MSSLVSRLQAPAASLLRRQPKITAWNGTTRRLTSSTDKANNAAQQQTTNSTSAATNNNASTTTTDQKVDSKITWMRGYLGAHSNTDPPDMTFMAIATVVFGAGFYAWFIDPPQSPY